MSPKSPDQLSLEEITLLLVCVRARMITATVIHPKHFDALKAVELHLMDMRKGGWDVE